MRSPAFLCFLVACGSSDAPTDAGQTDATDPSWPTGDYGTFDLSSTAFAPGTPIPTRHTCDAEDLSPALSWSGAPDETVTWALDLLDPVEEDVLVVHWLWWDLDAATTDLPEGVPVDSPDLTHGTTDMGAGYLGPCPPPSHEAHTYTFRLWAVDGELGLDPTTTREDLYRALDGRVLGLAELAGTYDRPE